jgi:hypothetical protein
MTENKKKRVARSVSIEENVYNRIVLMSERLGVNVNAYLLEAIGQKLFKDESLLRIEKNSADATASGIDKMVSVMQQLAEKENPSEH